MKTKYLEVVNCCKALKGRLICNGWNGIEKWGSPHVLVGIDIFSFCPFCGKKITSSFGCIQDLGDIEIDDGLD